MIDAPSEPLAASLTTTSTSPSSKPSSCKRPPRRGALLARIHRRYHTIAQVVNFNDVKIEYTRIADPDRVLDDVVAEEDLRERLTDQRRHGDELHLPYWAEVWESASGIGLALSGPGWATKLPGMRVLDLGCGMGMAGAVAARLGARVLFADLEEPALLFARLNSLPDAPRVRTRRLNWSVDRLDEQFDLILGSDILYERQQWDHLEPFWQAHLAPGGAVLLGEPGRQSGDSFLQWIATRPWYLGQVQQNVAGRDKPIRLFKLTRR